MKAYLSALAMSSVLAVSCSAEQGSKTSAVDSFDSSAAAAIKAVNANKKSQVYSAKGYDKATFKKALAEYMACEGIDQKMTLLETDWEIVRIVDHGKHSAMILNYGYLIDGKLDLQPDVWEFIAISNDASERPSANKCENIQITSETGYTTPRFASFSKAFPSPKTLRVGFENQPASDHQNLFYAELTDPVSITNVLKSVYTGSIFSRLEFDIAKKENGKLSWDPTPGRTWSVVNPKYDLTRGAMSIEIGDGFADLLDRDYDGAASGANYRMFPWSAGSVRQLMLNGELVEVLSPELAKERTTNTPEKHGEEGNVGTEPVEGEIGTKPVEGGFGTNPVGGGFGVSL